MPEWTSDHSVLVLLVNEKGKSIQEFDLHTGKWEEILEPSYYDIQRAIPWKNYILYHCTYSGIDNIYALDRNTGEKYQVTSSRFGVFDQCLAPSEDKIALSEYTSSGFNLVEVCRQVTGNAKMRGSVYSVWSKSDLESGIFLNIKITACFGSYRGFWIQYHDSIM